MRKQLSFPVMTLASLCLHPRNPYSPFLGAIKREGALQCEISPLLYMSHRSLRCAELIDSGEGLKVVTALLERLMADKGAGAAKGAWAATGMSLLDFVPKASTPAHLDVL